jgi:hypothetical protein
MKPKRNGRPLLIAAAGIAFVSFANCEKEPVGNLRAPENPTVLPEAGPAPAEGDAGTPTTTPVRPPG